MTELIWDGKYNEDGKKNAPARIALPFQTIETVNEPTQGWQKTLDLFAPGQANSALFSVETFCNIPNF